MNLDSDLEGKKPNKIINNPNKLTIELSTVDNYNVLATDPANLATEDGIMNTLGSQGSGRKGNPLDITNENIDDDAGTFDSRNDQAS